MILLIVLVCLCFGVALLVRSGFIRVAAALLVMQGIGFVYWLWAYNQAENDVDLMIEGIAMLAQGAGLLFSGLGWLVGSMWRRKVLGSHG